MTETPSEYIGTYVDYAEEDSSDYTRYKWSRFQGIQGEKGDQGIPGINGTNGLTYYLHIKYSNDGSSFTGNNGETPGNYIGVYTDTTVADSNDFRRYTWSKIKGEQGAQGISVLECIPLYYCTDVTNTPAKPTSPVTVNSTSVYSVWNKGISKWTPTNKYYFVCEQTAFSDGTYKWSDVVRDVATELANEKAYDADKKSEEAAKVATNYMNFVNNKGLIVGDMTTGTLGKNTLIDASGMAVRDGENEMARFGAESSHIGVFDSANFVIGKTVELGFFKDKQNNKLISSITSKLESIAQTIGSEKKNKKVARTSLKSNGNIELTAEGGTGISMGITHTGIDEDTGVELNASCIEMTIRGFVDGYSSFTPFRIKSDFRPSMGLQLIRPINPYISMRTENIILQTDRTRNARIDYVWDNKYIDHGQSVNFYPIPGVMYLMISKQYKYSNLARLQGYYIRAYIADEEGYIIAASLGGTGGGITITPKNDTKNFKPYIIFKGGSKDASTGATTKAVCYVTIKKIDSVNSLEFNNYLQDYLYTDEGNLEDEVADAYGYSNENK